MIYLNLFLTFFRIGLFTIGGGYAMIPLIQHDLLAAGWMNAKEINDLIAISNMTPGPFAPSAAVFAGMKLAGFGGAMCALLGVIAPSLIIATILARFFFKFNKNEIVQGGLAGIRPVVSGLIYAAAVVIAASALFMPALSGKAFSVQGFISSIDPAAIFIFIGALFLSAKTKVSPILIVIGAAVLGILAYAV